jgi:hypothetical protein
VTPFMVAVLTVLAPLVIVGAIAAIVVTLRDTDGDR